MEITIIKILNKTLLLTFVLAGSAVTQAKDAPKPPAKKPVAPQKKPTTPPKKPAAKPVKPAVDPQATYVASKKKVEKDLVPLTVEITSALRDWIAWTESLERYPSTPESEDEVKKDLGDRYIDRKAGVKKTKAEMLEKIPTAIELLKKLRSINPVPISLKKVDTNLARFSRDCESALEYLQNGLEQNDLALCIIAKEDIDKSYEFYTIADKELASKTDATQKDKKYIEG